MIITNTNTKCQMLSQVLVRIIMAIGSPHPNEILHPNGQHKCKQNLSGPQVGEECWVLSARSTHSKLDPPVVVGLLSNPVSVAHAMRKQLQTFIIKTSKCQRHVRVSRQTTFVPLDPTILGFCPKCKALLQYCILIDSLGT